MVIKIKNGVLFDDGNVAKTGLRVLPFKQDAGSLQYWTGHEWKFLSEARKQELVELARIFLNAAEELED